MNGSNRLLGCVAPVLAIGLLGAGGQARSADHLRGGRVVVGLPIVELAADGSFAAANLTSNKTGCGRILVWNGRTGHITTAYVNDFCEGETLSEVTVAGARIAWVERHEEGEMSSWLELRLFDLASQRRSSVVNVWPDGVSLSPARLGNVAGKGSLLVFTTSRSGAPNSRLWRVDSTGRTQLRADARAMNPVDVDANRILARRADGDLVLLKPDGSVLREFPFPRGYVRSAQLDGSTLVVQTKNTVVMYDASTGRAGRSWPTLGLEDADRGIAALRAPDGIKLLRLADGLQATIRLHSVTAARLTGDGLFFATRNQLLGFIPTGALPAGMR